MSNRLARTIRRAQRSWWTRFISKAGKMPLSWRLSLAWQIVIGREVKSWQAKR